MSKTHRLITWPLLYNPERSVLVGIPDPVEGLAASVQYERPTGNNFKRF